MSYKVLAPCVVRQDGGKSAVHHRQIGQTIEVQDKADADALVAGHFLELVEDAEPEEKSADEAKSNPKSKPGA